MQWNTMIFMHENEIQIHLQDGAFEHFVFWWRTEIFVI